MPRLDRERQKELEPKLMEYAMKEIVKLGYQIHFDDERKIKFNHKGHEVTLYPYSGWHSGKSINDGRGIKELINQLKP